MVKVEILNLGNSRTFATWHGHSSGSGFYRGNPTAASEEFMRHNQSPSYLHDQWWFNRTFEVQDHTRQLVFWAVDWQAYEDAERFIRCG